MPSRGWWSFHRELVACVYRRFGVLTAPPRPRRRSSSNPAAAAAAAPVAAADAGGGAGGGAGVGAGAGAGVGQGQGQGQAAAQAQPAAQAAAQRRRRPTTRTGASVRRRCARPAPRRTPRSSTAASRTSSLRRRSTYAPRPTSCSIEDGAGRRCFGGWGERRGDIAAAPYCFHVLLLSFVFVFACSFSFFSAAL